MRLIQLSSFALVITACTQGLLAGADAETGYSVTLQEDHSVMLRFGRGEAFRFEPRFTVLFAESAPTLGRMKLDDCNYIVPVWTRADGSKTTIPFKAADAVTLTASGGQQDGELITWQFADQPGFTFSASIRPGPDGSEPLVTFTLHARRAGSYSVGYTGAPQIAPAEATAIWQPLVWQERRFPSRPVLSTEYMCSLPATLVTTRGTTLGVVADPAEIPFRMPNWENARFGVMLRNPSGNAQPMLFAPVLGLRESRLEAGESFSFRLRLLVRTGGWFEAFRHLAVSLYGFRDLRENTLCNLNTTIENMIAVDIVHDEAGWNPEYKAFDYTTDVRGTVKLVSSLHPLALAVIRNDESLFRERALPMIEFLLSREKFLFAQREGIRGQNASNRMAGPGGEVFEWASLFHFSGRRTDVFRHIAEAYRDRPRALNLNLVPTDAGWVNDLAAYRATGQRRYLDAAIAGADRYIAERIDSPATDFSEAYIPGDGQFWTDFTPRWMQLFELYEATGERRHLEAARRGAELFAACCWVSPPVPDDTLVTVNPGGKVQGPYGEVSYPEARVPAWQLSQWGLTPEASTTYLGNPAIFLAHHAAYMLRIARETGDPFFRTLARNAIVGRYASFPGYDINNVFTNIYASPEYPLVKPKSARGDRYHSYNQFFLNHLWPHIALLTDYLISDGLVKSDGMIAFPSQYAQGYVYLQSKVYGHQSGQFYEDRDVYLYMPPGLVAIDNVQINYVAARGNGQLYLALLNQSPRPVEATIRFDERLSGISPGGSYPARIWRENRPAAGGRVENGAIRLPVAGRGITALAVAGAKVRAAFQEKLLDPQVRPMGERSWSTIESPFGRVEAMLISFGRGLTSGYVWLTASDQQIREARLHYRPAGGAWQEQVDNKYPFEFSLPIDDAIPSLELWVEGTPVDSSEPQRTAIVQLAR